jgi:hypothetical protein
LHSLQMLVKARLVQGSSPVIVRVGPVDRLLGVVAPLESGGEGN